MPSNAGVNKLARVLHKRIKTTNQNEDQLELGKILNDLSLQTDHFPIPIKKGEYLISRALTHDKTQPFSTTKQNQGKHPHGPSGGHSQPEGDGIHSHPDTEGDHLHDIVLPESMYPLKAGDRVLVAWVNQGTDVIVIDIVVSS